jgi:electron transfer flavoprotein beta subunit
MNIFVCVKQVPDTETKILPNADRTFIETSSIKWIMNPYDEYAVEQALIVQAANTGSTVTVLRVGGSKETESLRTALAMGADEAFLVEAPDNLDSYSIAKALKGAISKSGKIPDLILTGKQAIDDDCLQVPQILATMINIPSITVVVEYVGTSTDIVVKREVEGGTLEVYGVKLPALIACNKGINTPRYASLPGIMKAKKKPLTVLSLAEAGVSEADRRVKYSNFQLPPEKPPGKKFDALDSSKMSSVVKEIVGLLRTEAKII